MTDNKNQWALVTGSSTGIGYELAKLFAQEGYNVIITAQPGEDLPAVASEISALGVQVEVIEKDLFGEKAGTELYEEVKAKGIQVDVLVNNAGQGTYGLFHETDLEAQLRIVHLNIVSLTRLTYHFLKDMLARNSGKILQTASVVSELPTPWQAVYSATKAYVLHLTEALISEVKDSAVTITALQPGATDTEFFRRAGSLDSKIVADPSKLADPAKVARDGYDALMAGDDKVVSGTKNKVQVAMANLMPDTMLADNMKKQSEPVNPKDR